MQVNIVKLVCSKCGHKWVPRITDPRICPKCKSYRWDVSEEKTECQTNQK